MVDTLATEDYVTIAVYFGIVLAVGLWSTFRPNRGNVTGYFLAGKSMHWIPVGASIYASNIGAPMFIGLAGTAAASGLAVTIYEWHAVFILIALGWIFVPVYVSSGAFTMPEYLRKRFGGTRIRMYSSFFALIGYIFFNISAEIYSGAIFLRHILKWNMYLCVVVILAVTAVFTIVGGLTTVIYTDTLQSVVLIISSIILFVIASNQVGGWDEMTEKYMHSAANYTIMNQSLYSCGMPREDSLHIFRSATTGDIPWTGALTGLSIMGLYVWCQDQLIVQRTLSARDMAHAKAGTLLGGALKLLGLFTFIVPGMISRILYPDEIACADPDKCEAFCHNKAGCSNFAYPVLVLRLMPKGLRGLMLAALLAALMSSLTSILNSASAIATMDIWKQFRKKATQAELMVVGRVTVMILVVISIVWLPIMDAAQGGMFWFYFIGIRSYFLPQMCILFVLGLFWKRLTEQGAFWGLMISLVIGMIRMVLDFTFIKPSCGSGDEDTRPSIISKVDFTHFAAILAVLCCISMVVISLFTRPRPPRKLRRVTWWTKDDDEDPELSSEDDEEVDEQRINKVEIIEDNGTALPVSFGQRFCKAFKDWVCGTTDEVHKHQYLTQREIIHLRKKMKSIDETALYRKVLNGAAIIMCLLTAFLIGKFS
ncbi:solute carrier family 5 (sodium/glucose cotransporter), member 9 [Mytilus galloprovincialis]|uniref:Solute carrier family 5 (Sodium/glucose cotransporter), member 9 n=1 Tax=Mytilus galloprovincialis TaxID=29158 RepID=A0A8B6BN79_MYTGA|nr:solute carrier family 5 (sodium/glucose cotransporter), member 9 [Mytilus galloprovincialis]